MPALGPDLQPISPLFAPNQGGVGTPNAALARALMGDKGAPMFQAAAPIQIGQGAGGLRNPMTGDTLSPGQNTTPQRGLMAQQETQVPGGGGGGGGYGSAAAGLGELGKGIEAAAKAIAEKRQDAAAAANMGAGGGIKSITPGSQRGDGGTPGSGGAGGSSGSGSGAGTGAQSSDASGMAPVRGAIAAVESGGNYSAMGPVLKTGDRAYGKYQVMGENVPQWTKEALGTSMNTQEFLKNPAAQDKVFDYRWNNTPGTLADKASIWFSGRPYDQGRFLSDGSNTGQQYVQKFMNNLPSSAGGYKQVSGNISDIPGAASQIPAAPHPNQAQADNWTNVGHAALANGKTDLADHAFTQANALLQAPAGTGIPAIGNGPSGVQMPSPSTNYPDFGAVAKTGPAAAGTALPSFLDPRVAALPGSGPLAPLPPAASLAHPAVQSPFAPSPTAPVIVPPVGAPSVSASSPTSSSGLQPITGGAGSFKIQPGNYPPIFAQNAASTAAPTSASALGANPGASAQPDTNPRTAALAAALTGQQQPAQPQNQGLLAALVGGGGGLVPDGQGGYVPASNSRYDPRTGDFLPSGSGLGTALANYQPPTANAQPDASGQPADIVDRTGDVKAPWSQPFTSTPQAIIVHHSGIPPNQDGTPSNTTSSTIDTLNNRNLGAQFSIDRDGTVNQLLPTGYAGRHIQDGRGFGNGLNNGNTVGIEVAAANDQDVTPAQQAAALKLIPQVQDQYGMPGDQVYGHGEVNPGHKEPTEGLTIANLARDHYQDQLQDQPQYADTALPPAANYADTGGGGFGIGNLFGGLFG